MMDAAIELKKVGKTYKTGKINVEALIGVDITIKKGEMVAIMVPSGSGKSTLMHIIGLLDHPTNGELFIDGKQVDLKMADAKLAKLRSDKIGFVFQTFNLLSKLTALDNVLMPTQYRKVGKVDRVARAMELLTEVGLKGREKHRPPELSGGQIQRVAIARALANDPPILVADEPTGSLDSITADHIFDVFEHLVQDRGKTIIMVTHDNSLAPRFTRHLIITDGEMESITGAAKGPKKRRTK